MPEMIECDGRKRNLCRRGMEKRMDEFKSRPLESGPCAHGKMSNFYTWGGTIKEMDPLYTNHMTNLNFISPTMEVNATYKMSILRRSEEARKSRSELASLDTEKLTCNLLHLKTILPRLRTFVCTDLMDENPNKSQRVAIYRPINSASLY